MSTRSPGRRPRSLRARRIPAPRRLRQTLLQVMHLVVLVSLCGLLTSPVARAQTVDEARDQREATRAEQARVARELDALKADAATITAALDGLDAALAFQQAKVDTAAQALAAATATAAAAQAEVDDSAARIAAIKARVTDTVLGSYTGGLGRETEQFLGSSTATEASQRNALLDVVNGRYRDDLEQLRSLKERQRRATATSEKAVAAAAAVKAELDGARAELDAQRADQANLQAALQAKIGNTQAEADKLKAAEDSLTAVINQHLAEEAAAQGLSSATPVLSVASSSGFIAPADGEITSPFGYRIHPILGYSRLHSGTDFGASYGSPVWASKGGEVIFAGWNGGYGNCVIIAHAGGLSTLYGHMSALAVSEGDRVGQGETIGWVGSTGSSTGPHLHFEIWVGGEPTDPMNFL